MIDRERRAGILWEASFALGIAGGFLSLIAGSVNSILLGASDRGCSSSSISPCHNILVTYTGGLILIGILQFWASNQVLKRSSRGTTINFALGIVLLFMAFAMTPLVTMDPGKASGLVPIIQGYEILGSLYYLTGPIALGSGFFGAYAHVTAPSMPKRIPSLAETRP